MKKNDIFTPTTLSKEIFSRVREGKPYAFFLADFGSGPLVQYGSARFSNCVSCHIALNDGSRLITLDAATGGGSMAPLLLLLDRGQHGSGVRVSLYQGRRIPALEHQTKDEFLNGEILIRFALKEHGTAQGLVHAVFAAKNGETKSSLVADQSEELREHLSLLSELLAMPTQQQEPQDEEDSDDAFIF